MDRSFELVGSTSRLGFKGGCLAEAVQILVSFLSLNCCRRRVAGIWRGRCRCNVHVVLSGK